MSRIDDLIQELCPDGVTHLALGEVATYVRGVTYAKTDEVAVGGVGILRSNNIKIPENVLDLTDIKRIRLDSNLKETQRLSKNDILMSAASGSKQHVGKVAYIFKDTDFYFGSFMAVIRSLNSMNSRFLFHLLTSDSFNKHLEAAISSSTINNLNASILYSFRIPVPPLEVQREIVSILDKFTDLEAELEAELEARKKQFKYFCDDLYSASYLDLISKNVTKTLGEIGSFTRGNGLQKSDLTSGGAGCIHYGQIFTFYKTQIFETKSFVSNEMANRLKKASKGDLIIATTSENDADVCKAVVWLGSEEIGIGGETYIFRHNLDPLFSAYYFKSDLFQFQKHKKITGTKVRRVHGDAMAKFVIVVPEMQHQILIGQTLSKLESLLESMDSGLPAEIAARRKQYEHYRDQLLTFKELKSA